MIDFADSVKYHLGGMYQDWFLEYASYVILERAVPAVEDGLKPVQRRILHAMKTVDDGKMNKVANIVGQTMQYHPHGDASIGDALVQLGQKDLLIDCQGNWGNIFTGDGAAAPRYIEARLSRFALEVVFNPKITDWMMSYDGRKKEPVHLPVKFPLLLAQGVEGIAVGLNSKILPHNFNELCEAALKYLRGESFSLYPDLPTGGIIDVSHYNDGERGGSIRIRARISKSEDNKSLIISQIPFGTTTVKVIESIIRAQEKGKIRIKRVDDFTSDEVKIVVNLLPGAELDKTIDALYAFTDCEVSISTNCCVIEDRKPRFTSVSKVLCSSVEHTKDLLHQELLIEKKELEEEYFYTSLERIFIEQRIYKYEEYENALDKESVIEFIRDFLVPYQKSLLREVSREDIERLLEIKMIRITRFDSSKADEALVELRHKIENIEYDIDHLTEYTIKWFEQLRGKYGVRYTRRTEIRNFDNIVAKTVAEATEKLYINRKDGFVGTVLKKDEFITDCSLFDEIIVFYRSGKFKVIKVAEKVFIGTGVIYVNIFHSNDNRTTYNVVYRDGKNGPYYMKRFFIMGIMRDKEYDITRGLPESKIVYFSANANGEAEKVLVKIRSIKKLKKTEWVMNFSDLMIKGRGAMGNLLTRYEVRSISLKEKGGSTLGGRKIWFDEAILRLNIEGRGIYLGEFGENDKVLVVYEDGTYCVVVCSPNSHFEKGIKVIERYSVQKEWSLIYENVANEIFYARRFRFDYTHGRQDFLGEGNRIVFLSDNPQATYRIRFADKRHDVMDIKMQDFVSVRSYRVKGKRISMLPIEVIDDVSPIKVNDTVLESENVPLTIEVNTYEMSDVEKDDSLESNLFTE